MAWWDNAGAIDNCIAAYDAIGATSLADSYTDESGNGNDAAPGVAPTWASEVGWTFNGGAQYLTTGVTPLISARTWSVLVRFSGAASGSNLYVFGSFSNNARFHYRANHASPVESTYGYGDNSGLAASAARTAGVAGWAGSTAYFDGSSDGALAGAAGGGTARAVFLGARNLDGSAANFQGCVIEAFAMYSDVLSAGEVASTTTNMNALPNYSEGGGTPIAVLMSGQVR